MAELHRTLGLALGGQAGSRLARTFAITTSGDTLIRRILTAANEPEPKYRFVGVDDFAIRKGQVYGTILIDLERNRVIDLFDGRDGTALQAWLKMHPGVEIITRDRWSAYAEAASAGAPNALQVADRFHLVRNVRELVERLLDAHSSELDMAFEESPLSSQTPQTPEIPGDNQHSSDPRAMQCDDSFNFGSRLRASCLHERTVAACRSHRVRRLGNCRSSMCVEPRIARSSSNTIWRNWR